MRMASYIREDLKERISSGSLPPRLTLEELSRAYGVSVTPVRAALQELVRERFLRKRANGRVELSPDRPKGSRRRVESPAHRERLLAAEVLRHSLRGDAVYLREEAVASRHGMGRTVVRQAFGRLVASGILEHVPRRGWRVRPLREEELDAYLEVRETLELKALELARPRIVRAEVERLLARNEEGLDNDLHRYLLDKARNRYLRDFFDRHGAYFSTLFDTASAGAMRMMEGQHRRILLALLRRNWEAARQSLAQHIRSQRPVLKKMMERLATLPPEKWPEVRRI